MDSLKTSIRIRSSNEPTYLVGDYFLCLDFKIMKNTPQFGYVGRVTKIKKRKDGDHRYYYKTIMTWGEIADILRDEEVLVPGSMQFLGSQKITEEEVRFLKLVMS